MQDAAGLTDSASVIIAVDAVVVNPKPNISTQNNDSGGGSIAWQFIVILLGFYFLASSVKYNDAHR